MAFLMTALTPDEVKKIGVSNVRSSYNKLAETYNKIVEGDLVFCTICGNFITRNNFYTDKKYAMGVFPECKSCVLEQVEQRKKKGDLPNETKESVQKMLQKMDLPYLDEVYVNQCKIIADEVNEKNRSSPFLQYLTLIKSLRQYSNMNWGHSQFATDDDSNPDFEIKENKKMIKEGRNRFGDGYENAEIMYLQREYSDWVSRYECNTKSMEIIFQHICELQLERKKALKAGKPTKDLDKSIQDYMDSGAIKPKQINTDNLASDRTFGQLIRVWENEKPIPQVDEDLRDVNGIVKMISTYFLGHLCVMLGIENKCSRMYKEEMDKYTVTRPEYEGDSEALFDAIFGGHLEGGGSYVDSDEDTGTDNSGQV